jgi:hypothetical protein
MMKAWESYIYLGVGSDSRLLWVCSDPHTNTPLMLLKQERPLCDWQITATLIEEWFLSWEGVCVCVFCYNNGNDLIGTEWIVWWEDSFQV